MNRLPLQEWKRAESWNAKAPYSPTDSQQR
jgi:hypothetical protein